MNYSVSLYQSVAKPSKSSKVNPGVYRPLFVRIYYHGFFWDTFMISPRVFQWNIFEYNKESSYFSFCTPTLMHRNLADVDGSFCSLSFNQMFLFSHVDLNSTVENMNRVYPLLKLHDCLNISTAVFWNYSCITQPFKRLYYQ